MTLRRRLLVAGSMLFLATACGGANEGPVAPKTSPETRNQVATPSPEPTARATGPAPQKAKSVDPLKDKDYKLVDRYSQESGILVALGPDGAQVLMAEGDAGPILTIREPGGRRAEVRHPNGATTAHFGSAVVTDDWLVWTELKDTDASVERWVMYGYERKSGWLRQLSEAPNLSDGEAPPAVPGYSGPVVQGTTVVWPEAVGRVGDVDADLYACEIKSCARSKARLAKGAAYPKVSGEAIFFVERLNDSSYAFKKTGLGKNADTSTVSLLDLEPGEALNGFAVNADGILWAVMSEEGTRVDFVPKNEDVRTVLTSETGTFGYPVAGEGFFAWAESSGGSAQDIAGFVMTEQGIRTIGNRSGLYSILASGNRLSWQEAKGTSITRLVAQLN